LRPQIGYGRPMNTSDDNHWIWNFIDLPATDATVPEEGPLLRQPI